MKTINTTVPFIAVRRGLDTSIVSGEEQPRTRSRLAQWFAILALAIGSMVTPVIAQETGTVTISGTFGTDYLTDETGLYFYSPELFGVYLNGQEHTWTLTLHGATQSHISNGSHFRTEIHATSFDLEFFGPDADTLNGVVSEELDGEDVSVYLQNTYDDDSGGFATMHVLVGTTYLGNLYFYSAQETGAFPLFPTDADGYPVVEPEPFSIESEYTELGYAEMFSGTYAVIKSLGGPVTFAGIVGQPPPPPPPPLPPTLAIGDASVVEGDRGTSKLQFTVSRSGSTAGTVSVSYRTVDGTASSKSDYAAASGTLTFPPGVSSQTITISVKGDRKREPNETFTVELFNAVGASLADAVATGTILNDD